MKLVVVENEPNPLVLTDDSPIVKAMRNILGVPSVIGIIMITSMIIQTKIRTTDR